LIDWQIDSSIYLFVDDIGHIFKHECHSYHYFYLCQVWM